MTPTQPTGGLEESSPTPISAPSVITTSGGVAHVLEVTGLTKRFGATTALSDVSLHVRHGEVHALLGHNGSGKSTLVKILSGYHRPDAGSISFKGQPVQLPVSSAHLAESGIAFLHQDIGLVPSASVLENVRIGRFETGVGRRIKWKAERERLREQLRSFDLKVEPDDPVNRLSASQRTIVGLLRALHNLEGHTGGLLVLDEATAALPAHETEELLAAVREIATRGISVLLITHHLNEPLILADRVSILRDGKLVMTGDVAGRTERDLAEMVIGRERRAPISRPPTTTKHGDVLVAQGLSGRILRDVSLSVGRGEILGLTGLSGSGHDEVPYALYGMSPLTAGTVSVEGERVGALNPPQSIRRGLALVSGDRAVAGGVPAATVSENLSAPSLGSLTGPARWILRAKEHTLVGSLIERFNIKPGIPGVAFSTMSGGNQQKALIGRWMASPPKVLLLDEATSGVDIGAVDEIVDTLGTFASGGGAVILASTQYEDLARLADRVLVFRDGRVSHQFRGDEITAHELLAASYGEAPPRSTTAHS
ncbi:sugar ABC transporter ATP-binding protein [Naasia lichenicola]|uniref:Sugar ABC transporter ATP-binding protein n=1 Tax=Naasia lichenicola TaxID=2565933 RepID=A0A4S4FJI4_9MICO|nr:sugar ABC transporter ATP-binding protein [Naasia lichenicola]THG29296.1 sugar ABC transporter ATP-binding protein [Naasia lichenicola]